MGSSPHTRGLPAPGDPPSPGGRIIPAHAGFTALHDGGKSLFQDHPRTRGVYGLPQWQKKPLSGSSPHTRGLHYHGVAPMTKGRIIPAHAGFTTTATAPWLRRRDHPRTRGVYTSLPPRPPLRAGSSPHTRGLRPQWLSCRRSSGIIPAHAGFTVQMRGSDDGQQDHPRTRGVYTTFNLPNLQGRGSSPHTRGLRSRCEDVSRGRRIIPAHAGFTTEKAYQELKYSDHPRTRGVYSTAASVAIMHAGSSPHTRGLRETG